MNILVTTPTGAIGRHVVRELLAPEFSVRVICRHPARLPEAIRAQVEVIQGSLDDAATLQDALAGVEAVFFCVPSVSSQETEVCRHYERFARVMARAIREARTARVVTIAAVGKERARHAGPITGWHAMEDIMNQSGAAIRHLRCGALMENILGQVRGLVERGVLTYPISGRIPLPLVAAKDVADVALRWLVRRDWSGIAGVAVHGPEDVSGHEAAAIIERVLERPVRYQEVGANVFAQALVSRGASAEFAQSLVLMFGELSAGIARAESRTYDTTTTTRLCDWAREELLPLIGPDAVPSLACNCEI